MALIYRIKSSSKLAANAIPPSLTTLSVSWLNKQFRAVAIHRGTVEGTFENPAAIEGASHFESLLREAVKKTSYHGQNVSLLLAHQRLAQQLVDLPPVKGATLQKLIQRQAAQQKFFVGDAAYAYENCPAAKGNQRIILHLFPRILLGQLLQGCRKNDLYLTSVIPASAVLRHQITQLPPEGGDISLLAAETGNSTTLVVGRDDGQILLARTLPGTWHEDVEHLAVDLNRTILYVQQQHGVTVNKGVWLFGPEAQQRLPAIQPHIQLTVQASPVDYDPFYWATEAAKLSPASVPNFVSPLLQKAPQRRIFAKVVAAGTLLIVVAGLAAAAYCYYGANQEASVISSLSAQFKQLQAKQIELQRRNAELTQKKNVATLVLSNRPPPVPAWFLGYLGEAVPSDLVVTNLRIGRLDESWRIQLAGTFQMDKSLAPPPQFSNSVEILKQRLAGEPFHLALVTPKKDEDDQSKTNATGRAGFASWVTKVSAAPPTNLPPADHFEIEGYMR